jgi:FixJ family two-component response regulator
MTVSTKRSEPAHRQASRRVLVVEDDLTSRTLLRFALSKHGYAVTAAEDAAHAQKQLTPASIHDFGCVVADYRMPGQTGLELLAWIKRQDPTLATIIITAEDERELVAESLRGGAVDFLDKPVDPQRLRAAVTRAVQQTLRQRQLTESESAVKKLGRAQERMLGTKAEHRTENIDICFHPKHEAGGDFFSRFKPAPEQMFCLLTDVSGHDLQAAYISAYFQGVVRGMLERAAPVAEVFATFNRLLLDEWNKDGACGCQGRHIEASVAACGILIDSAAQTATVAVHGTPAPVYWRPDGTAEIIGETGGAPLGWFADAATQAVVQPIPGGGTFCLWTDGLKDVAEKYGVSELSLAWAVQQAKARHTSLAEIETAGDDVLVADLCLSPEHSVRESFRPLILEHYHGGQSWQIDELQAYWRRSLILAAPELPDAKLHDVLLSSREALLNALHHGCGGRATEWASFQTAYAPGLQTIRVRVCDPGPGHQFDLTQHERRAHLDLVAEHRGLILLKHLASSMALERQGASVTMDFTWP